MLAVFDKALGVLAQLAPGPSTAASQASAVQSPLIPPRLLWPGAVVIIVIAIFVAVALAGSLSRANLRDDIPPEHEKDNGPD